MRFHIFFVEVALLFPPPIFGDGVASNQATNHHLSTFLAGQPPRRFTRQLDAISAAQAKGIRAEGPFTPHESTMQESYESRLNHRYGRRATSTVRPPDVAVTVVLSTNSSPPLPCCSLGTVLLVMLSCLSSASPPQLLEHTREPRREKEEKNRVQCSISPEVGTPPAHAHAPPSSSS